MKKKPIIKHRMPAKNLGTIVHKDIPKKNPRTDRKISKQELRSEYHG